MTTAANQRRQRFHLGWRAKEARKSKLCASQLGHDGHAAWLRYLRGTAVNGP